MTSRWLLVLGLALCWGCSKKHEGGEGERIATFSQAEEDRGRTACTSYVGRICACEQGGTEVSESCELAKARTEALELALRAVHAASDKDPEDRWAIDQNARAIIEKCIKADLELDPQTCPRKKK